MDGMMGSDEYRQGMTGVMNTVVSDETLASEWRQRLDTTGASRYMNETSSGRLLGGLRTERFQGMVAYSMLDPGLEVGDMVDIMRRPDGETAKRVAARFADPSWRADPNRLEAADRDLGVLSRMDPTVLPAVLALRAWASLLADDADRAGVCAAALQTLGAESALSDMVLFALHAGMRPGRETTPMMPEGVRDPYGPLPDVERLTVPEVTVPELYVRHGGDA